MERIRELRGKLEELLGTGGGWATLANIAKTKLIAEKAGE
jgi:hypothetical protein